MYLRFFNQTTNKFGIFADTYSGLYRFSIYKSGILIHIPMKHLKLIILIIVLIFATVMMVTAKPTPYWRGRQRSGNGEVYTYSKANWGASYPCAGMYPHQPMKNKNFKRYHFYRHPKTHRRNGRAK